MNPTPRRITALQRLETQLKSKKKPAKEGNGIVELTANDVKRIKKEIATLKERV